MDSTYAVRALPYRLKFARPARTSRGDLEERAIIFIELSHRDDPTTVGWGECGPIPGLSRDDVPDFQARVMHVCDSINAGAPLTSLTLDDLPSLAFALETAQRDLVNGGIQRLWQTPFSTGRAGIPLHGLIWMGTPEEMLRQIEGKIAAGFAAIKLKVGALPFDEELALLHRVRAKHPADQIALRLDANGAFTTAEALQRLDLLAPLQIEFLEQPIAPGLWTQMARICRDTPIPIALDEDLISIKTGEERRQMLEFIRPQQLILKPLLLGGFATCEAWIADAEALGIQWWVNSLLESNVGLNAIAQWTSALDTGRIHGLGTGSLFINNVRSPLVLAGNQLMLDQNASWRLPPTDADIAAS